MHCGKVVGRTIKVVRKRSPRDKRFVNGSVE